MHHYDGFYYSIAIVHPRLSTFIFALVCRLKRLHMGSDNNIENVFCAVAATFSRQMWQITFGNNSIAPEHLRNHILQNL